MFSSKGRPGLADALLAFFETDIEAYKEECREHREYLDDQIESWQSNLDQARGPVVEELPEVKAVDRKQKDLLRETLEALADSLEEYEELLDLTDSDALDAHHEVLLLLKRFPEWKEIADWFHADAWPALEYLLENNSDHQQNLDDFQNHRDEVDASMATFQSLLREGSWAQAKEAFVEFCNGAKNLAPMIHQGKKSFGTFDPDVAIDYIGTWSVYEERPEETDPEMAYLADQLYALGMWHAEVDQETQSTLTTFRRWLEFWVEASEAMILLNIDSGQDLPLHIYEPNPSISVKMVRLTISLDFYDHNSRNYTTLFVEEDFLTHRSEDERKLGPFPKELLLFLQDRVIIVSSTDLSFAMDAVEAGQPGLALRELVAMFAMRAAKKYRSSLPRMKTVMSDFDQTQMLSLQRLATSETHYNQSFAWRSIDDRFGSDFDKFIRPAIAEAIFQVKDISEKTDEQILSELREIAKDMVL